MRAWGLVILWLAVTRLAYAQQQELSYAAFEQRVVQNHPLARQAALYADLGRAQLMEARGAFDPKLAFYNSEKVFGNAFYYRDQGLKATVPLRAGINLDGGYERVTGAFADPQIKTPLAGLYYGGLEVSLGRGLFIDSRRAGVLQGRNLLSLSQVLALNYGNKLVFDAAKDYWDWWNAWAATGYLQTGVDLALTRLNAVRVQVAIGEEAAIDTVEALILYQDRYNQLLTARQNRREAYLRLQTYFWQERFEPLQLDSTLQPEPVLPVNAMPQLPDDAVVETITRLAASL